MTFDDDLDLGDVDIEQTSHGITVCKGTLSTTWYRRHGMAGATTFYF